MTRKIETYHGREKSFEDFYETSEEALRAMLEKTGYAYSTLNRQRNKQKILSWQQVDKNNPLTVADIENKWQRLPNMKRTYVWTSD